MVTTECRRHRRVSTPPQFADVSHHEGDPNWTQYAASGRDYAVCKATEGTKFIDPTEQSNRSALSDLGLYCGLYHFAGSSVSNKIGNPVAEANYFLKTVGKLGPHEIPILDFELTYKMSPARQVAWMNQWLTTVEAKTGKTPWLYSYDSFLKGLDTSSLTRFPLWLAKYPSTPPDPGTPPPAHGWPSLMGWQYTDHQVVAGIGKTDDSYLYGSLQKAARKHRRPR